MIPTLQPYWISKEFRGKEIWGEYSHRDDANGENKERVEL